ncbi:outer membrane beta-barrel protein [Sphingomonas oleivorans]|uniref:outer membrane beta-barrel protein n=1 Tax=Sphingomonas oleivorans TaxID=1735121 RepID=UPI0013FD9B08|nr:outer membrane beta-barrel protein [Sphingomonas oleivorans]
MSLLLMPACAPAQTFRTGAWVSVATLYDDNLLRGNDLRPVPNQGDVRITPSLNVNIKRSFGRHDVYLKGSAGYDFYGRNDRLEGERIGLTGSGRIALGARCLADLSATADFHQTDVADLGVIERNRSRGRIFEGAFSCPKPAGLYPLLTASRTLVDNSSDLRKPFDLRSYVVGAALVYARPSLGNLMLFYSYGAIERPNAAVSLGGLKDETRIHRAGLRFERDVAARLRGNIGLSAIFTDPRLPTTPSFSGLGWQSEIIWSPSPATSLTTRFARDVRGESSFGVSFIVDTKASLIASRKLSARTTIEARAAFARRSLRGETQREGLPLRVSDRTTELAVSLDYALTDAFHCEVELGHSRRTSATDFYDYRSTRAGIRLGYRF